MNANILTTYLKYSFMHLMMLNYKLFALASNKVLSTINSILNVKCVFNSMRENADWTIIWGLCHFFDNLGMTSIEVRDYCWTWFMIFENTYPEITTKSWCRQVFDKQQPANLGLIEPKRDLEWVQIQLMIDLFRFFLQNENGIWSFFLLLQAHFVSFTLMILSKNSSILIQCCTIDAWLSI